MATRATISIRDGRDVFDIYRHHDGYPQSEHGVIADLVRAKALSWNSATFEAGELAAAVVSTMKSGPGSVYLTTNANLHSDRNFHYDLMHGRDAIGVQVKEFSWRTGQAILRFQGTLPEAAIEFGIGDASPKVSEQTLHKATMIEALSGAEYALADLGTAQRKDCLPEISRRIFAVMDAHRAELRAATATIEKAQDAPENTKPESLADLMRLPGFSELTTDSSGSPNVWQNFYDCGCGCSWDDTWSCQVDDECPRCETTCSPTESFWIGPSEHHELWESLGRELINMLPGLRLF